MDIRRIKTSIDVLHKEANDLDDVFSVQAFATVKQKLFENWPAISAELERLQAMARYDSDARDKVIVEQKQVILNQQAIIEKAREALLDLHSGWRYIREVHGDLPGVGWDRAENKAREALYAINGAESVGEEGVDR